MPTKAKAPDNSRFQADVKKTLKANQYFDRADLSEATTKFARFSYGNPYEAVNTTREYVFFTKPDLHLFVPNSKTPELNPELANIPYFVDCYNRSRDVMYQLQMSVNYKTDHSPFMNVLFNDMRTGIDFNDIQINTIETGTNIDGIRLEYPMATKLSEGQQDFSADFLDTNNLEIYHWCKLYYEYEKRKLKGDITPTKSSTSADDASLYTVNKILHDQFAAYKFIVDSDGTTILYWAKAYGVFPTMVPRQAMSDIPPDTGLKYAISFKAAFVEDMDPTILAEFNMLVAPQLGKYKNDIPLFKDGMINGEWPHVPYVRKVAPKTFRNRPEYELKWR